MNEDTIDECLVELGLDVSCNTIANKLLTFCRYIKAGKNVGELRVKDGSNHTERVNTGTINHFDFDYYFIFYKYEHLDENIYFFDDEEYCPGFHKDDKSTVYMFDPETNELDRNSVNANPKLVF